MTKFEIKEKIDSNNKLIREKFNPGIFVLNNTIAKIVKDNETLQQLCEADGHEYEDSACIYCYKEEPTNE